MLLLLPCATTASFRAVEVNAAPAWQNLPHVRQQIAVQCHSCRTAVMDGMVVKNITSDRVRDARKGVVEFLLLNHPLDCPICDQAGECHLQDLSYEHGTAGTRYEFPKRTFQKHDLGPYIQLHM